VLICFNYDYKPLFQSPPSRLTCVMNNATGAAPIVAVFRSRDVSDLIKGK